MTKDEEWDYFKESVLTVMKSGVDERVEKMAICLETEGHSMPAIIRGMLGALYLRICQHIKNGVYSWDHGAALVIGCSKLVMRYHAISEEGLAEKESEDAVKH